MSISFHFTLSFHAAVFLVGLGEHVKKFGKYHVGTRGLNPEGAEASWRNIPKGQNFILSTRQLKRQGLIKLERDDADRVQSWDVTAKGFAMIDVLENELGEIRETLVLGANERFRVRAEEPGE